MPSATMTIDTRLWVRRSWNESLRGPGAVDIVEDDATLVVKRAMFSSESCSALPQGCGRREREEEGGWASIQNVLHLRGSDDELEGL